jgi:hypothetical protein
MQTFNKITLMCCMFLTHTSSVLATDDISAQEIMAVGKMTGACGILDSMINFQKTTRMEGGEAFVLRFWEVEAAR